MARSEWEPGSLVGTHEILELIGRGGMCEVYKARHVGLGDVRAVKHLNGANRSNAASREKFIEEGQIQARLAKASPHVVQVHDAQWAGDDPHFAMELLRGESLARAAERNGRGLPLGDCVRIICETAKGLSAAHAAQTVHRDIKPDNLFLATLHDKAITKVIDFGVAKKLDKLKGSQLAWVGTIGYMAPEQMNPMNDVGPAADVFSLGLVAFFALTGHDYWPDAKARKAAQSTTPESRVRELVEQGALKEEDANVLPEGFRAWFSRCTQPDPAERFPSIVESADAFGALCQRESQASSPTWANPETHIVEVGDGSGSGGTATPVAATSRPKRSTRIAPLLLQVAALGGVALVAVGATYWTLTPGAGVREEPQATGSRREGTGEGRGKAAGMPGSAVGTQSPQPPAVDEESRQAPDGVTQDPESGEPSGGKASPSPQAGQPEKKPVAADARAEEAKAARDQAARDQAARDQAAQDEAARAKAAAAKAARDQAEAAKAARDQAARAKAAAAKAARDQAAQDQAAQDQAARDQAAKAAQDQAARAKAAAAKAARDQAARDQAARDQAARRKKPKPQGTWTP